MQRQATNRENIFANHIFDKNIIYRIYKGFSKFNSMKTNQSENGKNTQTKEEIYIENDHIKRCLTSLIIRETQNIAAHLIEQLK